MSSKFGIKKPLYPLIPVVSCMIIFIFGMFLAKSKNYIGTIFLGVILGIYILIGYSKTIIYVLPYMIVSSGIFVAIIYGITKDINECLPAVNRITTVFLAMIPCLGIDVVKLSRAFAKIKMPRVITLAMVIVITFMPRLKRETRKIKDAIKTRGLKRNLFNIKLQYRAFIIPLLIRVIDISDTLSLSIESRGFDINSKSYTTYSDVNMTIKDYIYIFLVCAAVVAFGVWHAKKGI